MFKKALTITALSTLLLSAPQDEIFSTVKSLNIGLGGYVIGDTLNEKQLEMAKNNQESANIPNTMKFKDGDYHVVVDANTKAVLVVYKNYDNKDRKTLKSTIAQMMVSYQEPTITSHGKMVYWFYNKNGKMGEADLDKHKDSIRTPQTLAEAVDTSDKAKELQPLLSVKLSSDIDIMPAKDINSTKSDKGDEKANYYVILSSEALLKGYLPKE